MIQQKKILNTYSEGGEQCTYNYILSTFARSHQGQAGNKTQPHPGKASCDCICDSCTVNARYASNAQHKKKKIDTESSSAPMLAKGITSQGTKNH